MAKQGKDIRARVEELVKEKADVTKAEIAEVLKKEGFKGRRGKALAPGSIAYYMKAPTEAATKRKAATTADAPKVRRRRVGSSAATQRIVKAVIDLTVDLTPAIKHEIILGLLKS